MFSTKKSNLFKEEKSTKSNQMSASTMVTENPFLLAALKETSKTTSLGNEALKYVTTGSPFVDQFGKITSYRKNRSFEEISIDMAEIWAKDPDLALRLTFYIRMITRKVLLPNGELTKTTQRGQGLKHEGIMRMLWIAVYHPDVFYQNLPLFIAAGSWKDIITMLSLDLQFNAWEGRKLDWDKMVAIILAGIKNPNTTNLVLKYLPQIRTKGKCHTVEAQADTLVGKFICSHLFGNKRKNGEEYKNYRKLKVSGKGHQWQQLISRKDFLNIDFGTIHGRALAQLVSGKFLENQNLEEVYSDWISKQPVAKYTGYVYELMQPVKSGYNNLPLKRYQKDTINKQFYSLIETAKKGMNDKSGLIVVLDTSSSMTAAVPGLKVSSYDVGKSMALYFSYLLKGKFNRAYLEFADKCAMRFWRGNSPVEDLQLDRGEAYGSTNFQAVGDIFANLLLNGVPESEFPTGILCISDGCFNSTHSNETNHAALLKKLRLAGFSEEFVENFKVILWDIPNNYYGSREQTAFEDFANSPNLFHMSGLDGSAIAFINGTDYKNSVPRTSEELFLAAMNQELLDLLNVKIH